MLHYKATDSTTLELLRELLEVDEFSSLRLVGGTALAFQLGHRMSVDLLPGMMPKPQSQMP
jgi:hypothetical protein